MIKEKIFSQNRAWATQRLKDEPESFSAQVEQQNPEILWIGCSDSRVPVSLISGLLPGEVFVHRNIANVVHKNDINLLSVAQYAVENLGVKHIVVCGHYGCGGVAAAMGEPVNGLIDHWLSPVRELYRHKAKELEAIQDQKQRHKRLCELSVLAQSQRLAEIPFIEKRLAEKKLALHSWIYALADGLLHDLGQAMEKDAFSDS